MTLAEMQHVADICSSADNGCSTCAQGLMRMLAQKFPEFSFAYGPDQITIFHEWDEEEECPSIYTRIVARDA